MRGHHCRQSHLHFARTCDSDYDADDWGTLVRLLPGTGLAAAEMGIDDFDQAMRHLAWLNSGLPHGHAYLKLRDMSMSLCLRPKQPKYHKDQNVPLREP